MERIELLLDLLDRWDETNDSLRVSPEEFCRDTPELLEDFRKVLQQRGLLTAILNGQDSPALNPESLIERLQSGRFPVVKFHDRGGLGWVYIARDRELGRTVALKCLQPDPATDPVACQRFVREAEITARLEHPGIVPIYGLGSYGTGDAAKAEPPTYAMRFVQGETLRDAIRSLHANIEKLDWRSIECTRILRSFVTVCDTIAFAHSRNVIHRDLKSANIMLGAFGETLVLDWGLAKLQHEEAAAASMSNQLDSGADSNATQTGATLGTVGFMSPEQARGDWEQVDESSDIFSLGAILYQVLTNQTPYAGSKAIASAQSCDFPPPQLVKSRIPNPLSAICLKAMEAAPSDRYASALDLKTDIERFLADEPVSAKAETILEKSQRLLRKHRTIVQMTGLMAIVAIVGLTSFLTVVTQKNNDLTLANQREQTAKEDAIRQRNRVQVELLKSIHERYAANMAQVSQSLNDQQPTRLVETLNKSAPRVGESIDPRGVEWWIAWNKAHGNNHPIPIDGKEVVGIRLVDRGSKALLWTFDTLFVIETQTGKELLKLAMKGTWLLTAKGYLNSSVLPIERPRDIPCSANGSTIAIPVGNGLNVYKLEGERYVHRTTLGLTQKETPSWKAVLVSENGKTIVGVELGSPIHVWNGEDYEYSSFKMAADHPTWEYRLSPDGRYLACVDFQVPTLVDLETKTHFSYSTESGEKFERVAFGQYGTLLAWNYDRVVTFAISPSNKLIELWKTQVSNLAGWDYTVELNGTIQEWITLEEEARQLPDDVIRERIQTGILKGLIKATTLAINLGSNNAPPRFHLLYRERAPGDSGTDVFDEKSKAQVRKSELTLPNLRNVVDISSDGGTALVRNELGEYSILASDSWAQERIYRKGTSAPIKTMAWNENSELRSVSSYGVGFSFDFVGHEPPNFTRWTEPFHRPSTPYSEGEVSESTTLPEGKGLGLSSDLEILARNSDNELIVKYLDQSAKEFRCAISADLLPYFEDPSFVGLRAWNRNENSSVTQQSINQIDLGAIHTESAPKSQTPVSLPWVLCLDKHSVKYPPGDSIDRIRVAIIDYQASRIVKEVDIPNCASRLIGINPTGRSFALTARDVESQSYSEKLFTWLVAENKTILEGPVFDFSESSTDLAFSPSGTQIAIGTRSGHVIVFDLNSRSIVLKTKAYEGKVNALKFMPDGKRLVTAGEDKTVRFFSTSDWQEVMKINCLDKPLCLAINNSSDRIAIGYDSGHIGILTAANSKSVLDHATLWLKQKSTATEGASAILRELWADFVTSHGRSEEEIEAGMAALESIRSQVQELSVEELKHRFLVLLPPSVDALGLGVGN